MPLRSRLVRLSMSGQLLCVSGSVIFFVLSVAVLKKSFLSLSRIQMKWMESYGVNWQSDAEDAEDAEAFGEEIVRYISADLFIGL